MGNADTNIQALRLQHRLSRLPTEDVIAILDDIAGSGTYMKFIGRLDEEILKQSIVQRKGPVNGLDADAIRRQKLQVVDEALKTRRYKSTKKGQLEIKYLPLVHTWRTADKLSWPRIVKQLQVEFRFIVSKTLLQSAYSDWLKRAESRTTQIMEASK